MMAAHRYHNCASRSTDWHAQIRSDPTHCDVILCKTSIARHTAGTQTRRQPERCRAADLYRATAPIPLNIPSNSVSGIVQYIGSMPASTAAARSLRVALLLALVLTASAKGGGGGGGGGGGSFGGGYYYGGGSRAYSSGSGNGGGISTPALLAVVSFVCGPVMCFVLWYYCVFRKAHYRRAVAAENDFLGGGEPAWPGLGVSKVPIVPVAPPLAGVLSGTSGPREWEGSYTEGLLRMRTRYNLTFTDDGKITGTTTDSDGTAIVTGKFNEATGRASWREVNAGVGSLQVCTQVCAEAASGGSSITALRGMYIANTRRYGALDLTPIVTGGTHSMVVGVPAGADSKPVADVKLPSYDDASSEAAAAAVEPSPMP